MLLISILVNGLPGWVILARTSEYRKKYREKINSEISETDKRCWRLRYYGNIIIAIACLILGIYFFPVIRVTEFDMPLYFTW